MKKKLQPHFFLKKVGVCRDSNPPKFTFEFMSGESDVKLKSENFLLSFLCLMNLEKPFSVSLMVFTVIDVKVDVDVISIKVLKSANLKEKEKNKFFRLGDPYRYNNL